VPIAKPKSRGRVDEPGSQANQGYLLHFPRSVARAEAGGGFPGGGAEPGRVARSPAAPDRATAFGYQGARSPRARVHARRFCEVRAVRRIFLRGRIRSEEHTSE